MNIIQMFTKVKSTNIFSPPKKIQTDFQKISIVYFIYSIVSKNIHQELKLEMYLNVFES